MKRKFMLVLVSCSLMALPTCLNLDSIGLGSGLICETLTGGLPFGDQIDYCSILGND